MFVPISATSAGVCATPMVQTATPCEVHMRLHQPIACVHSKRHPDTSTCVRTPGLPGFIHVSSALRLPARLLSTSRSLKFLTSANTQNWPREALQAELSRHGGDLWDDETQGELVGCVGICILARAVQLSARPSVRTVCAQRGGCADVPRACTFALYRFPLLPWSLLTLP